MDQAVGGPGGQRMWIRDHGSNAQGMSQNEGSQEMHFFWVGAWIKSNRFGSCRKETSLERPALSETAGKLEKSPTERTGN